MKNLTKSGLVLILVVVLLSCRKNPQETMTICPEPIGSTATVIGKWKIVTDSNFVGAGFTNHELNYAGQAGDYFEFSSDGKLYSKEGIKMDTSVYQLTSDTTILIPSFGVTANGVTQTSRLTNFTATHLTITAHTVNTPGGLFGRKVNLSR
ncbi:MAG: hypothetical protein ACRYGB_10480 [Janthinobacterium lividum]